MSNRFDQEFPRTDCQAMLPIDPDRLQLYLRRARQLRAEAFAEGLKLTARALARGFGAIAGFIGYAGYEIAKQPPEGTYAITTPSRLNRDRG
jgi:hypothetical protein